MTQQLADIERHDVRPLALSVFEGVGALAAAIPRQQVALWTRPELLFATSSEEGGAS